jgi:hypothetical protein
MYIDLPNKDTPTTIDRIRIGDIIVKNSARTAEPPFAKGAFYYFIEENALLRWDGTDWVQINSVKAIDDKITVVEEALDLAVTNFTKKDNEHDTAIAARLTKEEFETFKTSNTTAINNVNKAAQDAMAAAGTADEKAVAAKSAADAAQDTADNAVTDAAEAKRIAESKTTMAEVEGKDYATKT